MSRTPSFGTPLGIALGKPLAPSRGGSKLRAGLCLLLMAGAGLRADTFVNRVGPQGAVQDVTLSQAAIWTAAGSPYVVEANVTANAALTIESGATVKVNAAKGFTINGTLLATNAIFTINGAGNWYGIYLAGGAGGSVLDGCTLENAGARMGYLHWADRYTTLFVDGCSPAIINCKIRNSAGHGLELYSGSPVIRNTAFSDLGGSSYPVVFNTLDCFPPMSGNSANGTGIAGVSVPGGDVTVSGAWSRPGNNFPYFLNGNVTVKGGVTLEIAAGVSCLTAGFGCYVDGTLRALGTETAPVIFSSRNATPAAGDWRGLYFGGDAGASELHYLTVAYAGAKIGYYNWSDRYAAIFLNYSSPKFDHLTVADSSGQGLELYASSATITNAVIRACAASGLRAWEGSRPALADVSFSGNGTGGAYAVSLDASSVPDPSRTVFAQNQQQGIEIRGGSLPKDATWKNWSKNTPYAVTGSATVPSEGKLIIEAGTTIKFLSTGLYVEGTVTADGTTDPITFSSLRDDSIGGDTTGDGAGSQPAGGNWKGLYLSPAAGGSVFKNCVFRYAGDRLGYYNWSDRYTVLYINQSAPLISQCTIEESSGNGIEVYAASPVIQKNTLRNFGAGSYALAYDTVSAFPVLAGNTVSGAGFPGISLPAGSLTGTNVWNKPGAGLAYYLNGEISLAEGALLVIDPGVTVKAAAQRLMINGTLRAVGTEAEPILFTSRNDKPAAGDWKGIYFGPKAGDSVLSHVTLAYGGNVLGYFNWADRFSSIYCNYCSPRFDHLTVANSYGNGIDFYAASPSVSNLVVEACGAYGLWAEASSRPTLADLALRGNGTRDNGYQAASLDGDSVPVVTRASLATNRLSGIQVRGGRLMADGLWQHWATNAPYVVTGDVSVDANVTLTIESGANLKFQGAGLYVNGVLTAKGDPVPISLTSWRDDSVAGDSNGDADAAAAQPGDWKGVYLSPASSASVLDNCRFRFAGKNLGYYNWADRLVTLYVNGSAPVIRRCTIADSALHGIDLYDSAATLQNNIFSNFGSSGYAVVNDTLTKFPDLSGNTVAGAGIKGILVAGGTMGVSSTWHYPGPDFPYYLSGDVTVAEGVTLTLEPGVSVRSDRPGLYVNGTLMAAGTPVLPIEFTSRTEAPAPGDWRGIYFGPNAGGSVLRHATVAHAGQAKLGYYNWADRLTAIYVNYCSPQFDHLTVTNSLWNGLELYAASPVIVDSLIQQCKGFGLRAEAGSRPTLQSTRFTGNGEAGSDYYTIGMDASSVPDPANVTFADNKYQGVRVWGGRLDGNGVWRNWSTNAPYVVTADVTVAGGVTLTIEPGTNIKFKNAGLYVEGLLTAEGDSAPISFSSWADDAAGGDSNGDAAASKPAAGDWKGIYLAPAAGGSVFSQCAIRYAGQRLGYYNWADRYSAVYVNQCSPSLAGCTVADSAGHGIELYSSQAAIVDCVFSNFGADAYPVVLDTLDCFLTMSGNTVAGTGVLGIAVPGGTLSQPGTWPKPGVDFPYFLNADVSVAGGVALSLEPGVVVKALGRGLYVDGTLLAVGTPSEPIIFTSRQAAPAPGDWKGIYFGPGSGDSTLSFCNLLYTGARLGYYNWADRFSGIYVNQCDPAFSDLIVAQGARNGFELEAGAARIQNCLVYSNAANGLQLNSGATARIVNSTIVGNGGHGVYCVSGSPTLANNVIAFNAANGVKRDAGTPVLVRNCLFGNTTANYGTGVTPGVGDVVSDPLFVDRAGANFRLTATSPAINLGDSTFVQPQWMDLDGHLRIGASAVDAGAFEQGTPLATHTVDALIRLPGEASYLGENVFVMTNQTKTQTVNAGAAAVYQFQLKYSGNAPDTARVLGTPGTSDWSIKYFDAPTGGAEITDAITSPAGYAWTNLAAGSVREMRVEVTPGARAVGRTAQAVLLSVVSRTDPARRDTVEALTVNSARLQPDLAVQREADLRYTGKGTYNTTAEGQTKSEQTDTGVPVVYYFQVVNEGNLPDLFAVRVSGGSPGWSWNCFDALTGGSNVTTQAAGQAWITPVLGLGASLEFRLEVVAGPNAASDSVNALLVTAVSGSESSRADAAKAVTTLAPVSVTPQPGLYTLDVDFERGALAGVEYQTVHDQLQLSQESITLPFIWVPNSNEGTVSKVDTRTGRELARYRTGPDNTGNPSRTTVDQQGNCWVANRHTGTAVKIGLFENGQYADRNTNGVIETSRDLNNDGQITGDEILPWGKDECVLVEVVLIPGKEGPYAPGAYLGGYANNDWDPGPRGVAVDAKGNVWLGTHDTRTYYYVEGLTGKILKTIDVSSVNHTAYGAVIDAQGILWSSGQEKGHVLRLDPADGSFRAIAIDHYVYGLGLDHNNHLFLSGWQDSKLSRVNVLTGQKEWTRQGIYQSRGIAVTDDGDVWVANSGPGTVARWSNDGIIKASIPVGTEPTGVAVDAAGKVWAVNNGDEYIKRIDPATDKVDLAKPIVNGRHYGYSDMTGILSRSATTKLGVWTVIHDSQFAGATWGTLAWHALEPQGTSVKVRARSAADGRAWSAWENATNGVALTATPPARYLKIEVSLQTLQGGASPLLYDLSVTPGGVQPVEKPRLAVRLLNDSQTEISWQPPVTGFTLEFTHSLTPQTQWTPIPQAVGGLYVAPLEPGAPARFYRLRK